MFLLLKILTKVTSSWNIEGNFFLMKRHYNWKRSIKNMMKDALCSFSDSKTNKCGMLLNLSVSVYAQTCVNLRRNQMIYAHNIYLGVRLTQKYL